MSASTNKMVSLSPAQVTLLKGELGIVLDSPAFTVDDKILAAEILKKLNGRKANAK